MSILEKMELALSTGKEREVLIEAINAFKKGYLPNETLNGKPKILPTGIGLKKDLEETTVTCDNVELSAGVKMVMIGDVPEPAVSISVKGEKFRMGWSEIEQVYGRHIRNADDILLMGVAIYLSEYASERARGILKPVLEVLAGIPTVVYGYFALTFMTPLLRSIFGVDVVQFYNMASAGLVMGILILPLVSSMSEDSLRAVPRSLREAAFGLGATKLETALRVVLPAAFSGISAAFIIAISRAIGETMIVALASGAGPNFTFNPFQSAETMTGHIVRISGGDLSYDSIDYSSIFAIGLLLFIMTLGLNVFSRALVRRFREEYQ